MMPSLSRVSLEKHWNSGQVFKVLVWTRSCWLPDYIQHGTDPTTLLVLGKNCPIPIDDMTFGIDGWHATLAFRGEPYTVYVPYEAIMGIELKDKDSARPPTAPRMPGARKPRPSWLKVIRGGLALVLLVGCSAVSGTVVYSPELQHLIDERGGNFWDDGALRASWLEMGNEDPGSCPVPELVYILPGQIGEACTTPYPACDPDEDHPTCVGQCVSDDGRWAFKSIRSPGSTAVFMATVTVDAWLGCRAPDGYVSPTDPAWALVPR